MSFQQLADNTERLRIVWSGDSQADCVDVCQDLMRAEIRYRVNQHPISRSSRMSVVWNFQVGVADQDYQRARKVLGLDVRDNDDQPVEIKESIDPPGQLARPENKLEKNSYLQPLDPNEAIEEIYSQEASDPSSIVELSLKENLIRYRVRREESGRRKFLVAARDKARAREVLRQIERGEPFA